MKKMFALLATTAMFLLGGMLSVSAATEPIVLDTSKASEGTISVQYTQPLTKKVMVQIVKDKVTYTYNVLDNEVNVFPLQSGTGTYKISVAEGVAANKYRVAKTATVTVDKFDEKKVFTSSIQLVNFNGKMVSIVELNKLVAGAKTDRDKLDIIYKYIINNFSYDFDKVSEVAANSSYIPVIDKVYAAKKGICYDYASLFAAILRANGIPAKLNMGYYSQVNEYHAWNEVLVDGEWMIIDTTYDSQANEYKMKFTMKKDAKEFKVVKQY